MSKSAFVQRLESRMDEIGISLAELSRRSGVSYHQIHTWRRRENAVPNASSLEKVAKALSVSPGHLLNGDPVSNEPNGVRKELLALLDHLSTEELHVLKAAAEAMNAKQHSDKP